MICRRGLTALILLCAAMAVQAEMQLNGVADFTELRRSFYLAGLYVERTSSDEQVLVESDQRKRMVLKVTADRWSPRSFSSHWTRSLLINNPSDSLNAFSDAVIEFNNLLRDDLMAGDVLEIERDSSGATQVRLNGTTLFELARPGFTEMLLRTWIGNRPPSTEFRQQILGLEVNPERMARFTDLNPAEQRVELTAAWADAATSEPAVAGNAAEAQQAEDDAADQIPMRAPPSRDTVVRASMSATPAVAEAAVPAAAVAVSMPAPEVRPAAAQPQRSAVAEQTLAALQPLPDAVRNDAGAASPVVEPDDAPQPAAETSPALSAEEEKTLIELYQNMVVRKILSRVQYPEYALRRGLEGVVQLRVQVNRTGEILDIEEVVRTRYEVLNEAGRRAVTQIGEFPRVPAALPGDIILVDVPIRFQLR